MQNVPAFVSVVFMVTTFVTVGIFLFGVRSIRPNSFWQKLLLFLTPFCLLFQFIAASDGFYLNTGSFPPRLFLFGLAPSLLVIVLVFLFARDNVLTPFSLTILTVIHIIRIPVELTLAWLADAGVVPNIMTFHGNNLDILSGLTAPIALYFAFRPSAAGRYILIFWNLAALALLFNIVIIALLSLPSPMQRIAFEQPNIAILYFPYIWLPTAIVPIVLFSHLAVLYKLAFKRGI
ncbi:MAG: hypothetical protein HOP17_13760 [Acidobacteria bacterium]|nr:hypothetical protein [Acidobacteriota bacterium]